MKKRLLSLLTALSLVLCMIPVMTSSALAAYAPGNFINSSWYGKYIGSSGNVSVERYMNMTITSCDSKGNIAGNAYVTTEVPGYTNEWVKYNFKGTVNLNTGAFTMQGNKITSANSSTNWSLVKFTGTYTNSSITGVVDNNSERTFSFGLVSGWAKDEVTQADLAGLIPNTLYGKDLRQAVTRAEFAAISVKLYETLTGETAPVVSTPFTDINGSADKTSIAKAYGLNITVGVTWTQFAPNTKITREQLATMLTRVIKKYAFANWTYDTDSQYYLDTSGVAAYADDADISAWAKPSVYYLTKMGIVRGIENHKFAPKAVTAAQQASGYATATREQAIALSKRVYDLSDVLKP